MLATLRKTALAVLARDGADADIVAFVAQWCDAEDAAAEEAAALAAAEAAADGEPHREAPYEPGRSAAPAHTTAFALRLCARTKRTAGLAEILLRRGDGLESVRLLLRDGRWDAARQHAARIATTAERHRGWLEVLRATVAASGDDGVGAGEALAILREANGDLTIYDVFPRLPDSVAMSALSDGLIDAVGRFSEHMRRAQSDVTTALALTRDLVADRDAVRGGPAAVDGAKRCDVCRGPLLLGRLAGGSSHSAAMRVYPGCGHAVHVRCQPPAAGNDGLGAARDLGGVFALDDGCPLCSSCDAFERFLTAPIELPPGHAAHLIGNIHS
jgi:hypothetical protein